MQDRPTADELLAAIERFLDDEAVPNLEGGRGFHARVAANAIRTIRRELALEEEALTAEWSGLDALLGPAERPDTRGALREALHARNQALCERLRSGELDATAAFDHVHRTLRDKLRVSDPGLLARDEPEASSPSALSPEL